jgi:hypothetical protein
MNHSKAIVTMAVGGSYLANWRRVCEPNWQAYAQRHGYDIICIDHLLDDSPRAQARRVTWQKCLILEQESVQRYERVVWLDADILINLDLAPCMTAGVPPEKVGVLDSWWAPTPEWRRECLKRTFEFWGDNSVVNYDTHDYYRKYGFPKTFDAAPRNGMMVLSPAHHRDLLKRNYYDYEDRGMRWNDEMRPFAYELMNAGCAHWLDARFDLNWWEWRIMHYPFLANPRHPRPLGQRVRRKLARALGTDSLLEARRACVNATFCQVFSMHFPSNSKDDMLLVDFTVKAPRDCQM